MFGIRIAVTWGLLERWGLFPNTRNNGMRDTIIGRRRRRRNLEEEDKEVEEEKNEEEK